MDPSLLQRCQEVLNYRFNDPTLLKIALTHSSIASSRVESNERLEFLGDVVMGLIICEKLYRDYEQFQEGELTKIKSAVVSRRTCAEVADEVGMSDLLMLGRGFEGQSIPSSIAAAVLESLIGAIYLDGGLEAARAFVLDHMTDKITAVVENQHARNYKSMLQQYLQKEWNTTPTYELLDEKGPDHAKAFEVCVACNGRRFASSWGNNKKDAEQLAARAALAELGVLDEDDQPATTD